MNSNNIIMKILRKLEFFFDSEDSLEAFSNDFTFMVHRKSIILCLVCILLSGFIITCSINSNAFAKQGKKNKTDTVIEAPAPDKSGSPDSSKGGTPSQDLFSGDTPIPFKLEPEKFKSLRFTSGGKWFNIPGYCIEQIQVLVPVDNPGVKKILENFFTTVEYDKDTKIITFTRENDKKMMMKIDYNTAYYDGEKKEIPIPPRLINDKPYISPLSFSKFIWAYYNRNEKNDVYYLDSWLLDVNLETTKRGKVTIVAKGTGTLKYQILKLRNPTRFVIDVMNACLDGKARSLHHPTLGEIRYSQNELMSEQGNIVRIVIPESEDIEIVMQEPRSPKYVEANLRPRSVSAPVQDMAIQKITGLKVEENGSNVTVILDTSGAFQMEWSRLLDPDNRFFLDIPGMIYPEGKRTIDLKTDYLPQIKIAQFEPKPNPSVRMVFKLEDPKKISLITDDKQPGRIKIIISKENIDPKNAARKGFIITSAPQTGLVICIDPGHGGSDPGAVNRKLGLLEKTVTLDIANRLKTLLVKEGWIVVMTRSTDRDVTYPGSPDAEELYERSRIANDLKAHVFISIHADASNNSAVNGVTTYWSKTVDKPLADQVQSALAMGTGRRNIGTRRMSFSVIKYSRMPAVLVEVCFISNPVEAKLLTSPAFRQKAAEALMRGLRNYAHKTNLKKLRK